MLSLFLFATVGMIAFLNFSDHEVRDRDYFFTTGYHAYALWMGLGLAWLAGWIGESFPAGRQRRLATGAAVALLAVQPALVAKNLWFSSDASRNTVARDYAWNMLAPLAPNSYVFTNGDNDTYPLWYIQQVEGFRKDVRVVCLALLQTDWYIFQLRDEEPKVPIRLSDEEIRGIGIGWLRDAAGNVMATNTFMVHHILEESKRDGGWVKQPYFAVTAPDHRGYDPYLSLEGMVYRVNRDTLQDGMDVPAMERNLYHRFRYDGLFLADGSWDRSVYKDDSAILLTRNYASAHAQLAMRYHARGDLPRAIAELERVQRMFPSFTSALVFLGQYYLEGGDTDARRRAAARTRAAAAGRPAGPLLLRRDAGVPGRRGRGAARVRRGDPPGPRLRGALLLRLLAAGPGGPARAGGGLPAAAGAGEPAGAGGAGAAAGAAAAARRRRAHARRGGPRHAGAVRPALMRFRRTAGGGRLDSHLVEWHRGAREDHHLRRRS